MSRNALSAGAGPIEHRIQLDEFQPLQTRLWWISVGDELPIDEARIRRMMSPAEIERLERFRHEPSKRCHLAARYLVRTKLAELGSRRPGKWRFATEAEGRPVLDNPTPEIADLDFNLAHSHRAVALAIGRRRRVGVDIEPVDREIDYDLVADRFFAPREREAIAALDEASRHRRFLKLWVLKEAWMKADGRGLGAGLSRVVFSFDQAGGPKLIDLPEADPADWRVGLGEVDDHLVALARIMGG